MVISNSSVGGLNFERQECSTSLLEIDKNFWLPSYEKRKYCKPPQRGVQSSLLGNFSIPIQYYWQISKPPSRNSANNFNPHSCQILRNMVISSGHFSGANLSFAKKGFFWLLWIFSRKWKPQYFESTFNLRMNGI